MGLSEWGLALGLSFLRITQSLCFALVLEEIKCLSRLLDWRAAICRSQKVRVFNISAMHRLSVRCQTGPMFIV